MCHLYRLQCWFLVEVFSNIGITQPLNILALFYFNIGGKMTVHGSSQHQKYVKWIYCFVYLVTNPLHFILQLVDWNFLYINIRRSICLCFRRCSHNIFILPNRLPVASKFPFLYISFNSPLNDLYQRLPLVLF